MKIMYPELVAELEPGWWKIMAKVGFPRGILISFAEGLTPLLSVFMFAVYIYSAVRAFLKW